MCLWCFSSAYWYQCRYHTYAECPMFVARVSLLATQNLHLSIFALAPSPLRFHAIYNRVSNFRFHSLAAFRQCHIVSRVLYLKMLLINRSILIWMNIVQSVFLHSTRLVPFGFLETHLHRRIAHTFMLNKAHTHTATHRGEIETKSKRRNDNVHAHTNTNPHIHDCVLHSLSISITPSIHTPLQPNNWMNKS